MADDDNTRIDTSAPHYGVKMGSATNSPEEHPIKGSGQRPSIKYGSDSLDDGKGNSAAARQTFLNRGGDKVGRN